LQAEIPGDDLVTVPELCELKPGEADGMTIEEVDQEFGLFDMIAFPDRAFAPNGESWSAFNRRVRDWLHQLTRDYRDETIVAVTHGGLIVVAMITLLGIARPGTGAQLHPSHTSITEWVVAGDNWQLVRYNDTYHLRAQ
jgi:alpha-ribazole phosphatase/probable phosphoglycerate mutase